MIPADGMLSLVIGYLKTPEGDTRGFVMTDEGRAAVLACQEPPDTLHLRGGRQCGTT